MSKSEICIVLPGLAPVLEQEINALSLPKLLTKLLSKGRITRNDLSFERNLVSLFVDTSIDALDLPLAELRTLHRPVICADPCYLHADRDQLLVFADDLTISHDQAQALIDHIQPLFDDYGATLQMISPQHWCLQLSDTPDVQFTALADVSGKAIQTALPIGSDKQQWIRLWNEVQMTLFDAPVNQQRQEQGLLPINGLWFWGQGELVLTQGRWDSISGQHQLIQQFADRLKLPCLALFQRPVTAVQTGAHLIVHERLDLEQDWIGQLELIFDDIDVYWQQLKWARIAKLTLIIPHYGEVELTPFSYWKFL